MWIGVWALVPWANAGANVFLGTEGVVWEQGNVLIILNYAALSVGIAISLVGTARIVRRLESLGAMMASGATQPFRGMNSVAGPIALSVGTSVALGAGAFFRDGWSSAFLRGVTWFIIGVALWTFIWTYASLLSVWTDWGASVWCPTQPLLTQVSDCNRSVASPRWGFLCCSCGSFLFS
jgi:hypothetical protein